MSLTSEHTFNKFGRYYLNQAFPDINLNLNPLILSPRCIEFSKNLRCQRIYDTVDSFLLPLLITQDPEPHNHDLQIMLIGTFQLLVKSFQDNSFFLIFVCAQACSHLE